ncbi:MAG: pca operon transcription factor PcaQ [Rhizobiaceae bacterium]
MTTISSRIKFRHLQCFLETARLQSVGKAAKTLSISQPAVSKTLRELENELGVKLFERIGRSIRLSGYGEIFQRYAGASISSLKQGVDLVAQARSADGFRVRIGALPTVSTKVLPSAISAFKQQDRDTIVEIITGENAVLMSQLQLGDLDLVVGRLTRPDQMLGLSFEHLYTEQIGLFVREGHPLLKNKPFILEEIANFTILMPGKRAVIRPTVDQFLAANGFGNFTDVIETVSTTFCNNFVKATDAVWIISRGVASDQVDAKMIVELPVDTSTTTGPVGLTMRADTPLPLPAQLLTHHIREASQK